MSVAPYRAAGQTANDSAVILMAFVLVLGPPDTQLRNQFEADPSKAEAGSMATH